MAPDKAWVLMLVKRQLSVRACDAVNLEVINLTLPEIQKLPDDVTVKSHKVPGQDSALNQAARDR